jgi:Tol biopolymer transport system component
VKQLTDAHGYDAEGGFSPDGKKIVFCSLRDAYPVEELTEEDRKRLDKQPDYFGEIYIMDADGGNQTRLTDWPGYDGGPFFTPDGQRIIWRHFTEDGLNADVYTMKPDGSDVRRLTDFKAMSWAPFFHPSGEYVLFVSNKLGFDNFEIFMVDAMGTRQPVQVTYTQKFDGLPTFSPDGKTIVWTSNHTDSGMSQLFTGSWDHEAAAAALAKAPKRK